MPVWSSRATTNYCIHEARKIPSGTSGISLNDRVTSRPRSVLRHTINRRTCDGSETKQLPVKSSRPLPETTALIDLQVATNCTVVSRPYTDRNSEFVFFSQPVYLLR